MSDLRELYQEVILDHSRKPRNFGAMPDATRQADGKSVKFKKMKAVRDHTRA